jgi:hypothetical protein
MNWRSDGGFAGVSEAGARSRHPERSEGSPIAKLLSGIVLLVTENWPPATGSHSYPAYYIRNESLHAAHSYTALEAIPRSELRKRRLIMKNWSVAAALVLAGTCAFAQSEQAAPAVRKPCEDLKAEIAKKLDAKNVVNYTLDVVDKGKEGEGKVVGSCDGGTKSILYSRGGAAQSSTANTTQSADAKKPQ